MSDCPNPNPNPTPPAKPELTPLNPPERKRTYHHRSGAKWEFFNVTQFLARPSGTHRLKTADGRFWIVPAELVKESVIELDMDDFTL